MNVASKISTPPPFKECKCGAHYTREQWEALRFVGVMSVPAYATWPGYELQLRDCSNCNSTISIPAEGDYADR